MLFKNKICPKCKSSYDEAFYTCPNCKEKNDLNLPKSHKSISFIPPVFQIGVFLIGWIGLQVLFVLMQFIVSAFVDEITLNVLAVIDYGSYVFLFGALVLTIMPFIKSILQHFKKWENYIFGIGYGVTLIVVTMLYSLLISQLVNVSDNANQQTAQNLTKAFPFLALIFLGFIGPICEELTYRLGLFSLLKRINKFLPYILVPIIFGFIHFDFTCFGTETMVNELVNVPSYIIAGLILSLAYSHKGLACSTTAHIINNVFSLIMILIGI